MTKKLILENLSMGVLVAMVNALGGSATSKTFSQRSKAVERVNRLAAEQGLKLEDKFDLDGNVLPPPPRAPKADDKKDKTDKPVKEKKEKGPSIRSRAEQLLLEVVGSDGDGRKQGHTYEAILEKIKAEFPQAKTSIACLRWYAVHMRERSVMPPNRPRAVPPKATQETADTQEG
jgi:hypothetical protein